ncbi:hypothetical protein PLICRDRAFT_46698 [Plicaturopsis crispa FD-325 SS-3]|uniref:FAR-17a/AIG1-like protein n=1 Tax=Plicaturopsis crispa FD-325 SS-3 TaxID=944288 RepID=A0A0C9SKL1_PLICR|nr:hypothetical protein PLICRDRAFT_46698 [Plicaturopsis crispa FD-325 SS-3]
MRSLSYATFGVSVPFDPEHRLVTSPVFSPLVLALTRLLLALYALCTSIYVLARIDNGPGYFAYFTRLTYIGLLSYLFAAGVQTLAYALKKGGQYPLQHWPRPLQFLHLLLQSTITTFPFIVTIAYWGILLPADPSAIDTQYGLWSNISQHALNCVFALFEILFGFVGPAPWSHLPFLIVILALYLALAYITHATAGFYTYSFLDPSITKHGLVAAYVFGIAIGQVIIFSLVRGICILRNRIAARLSSSRGGASDVEAIDEWEEIDRPGTPKNQSTSSEAMSSPSS